MSTTHKQIWTSPTHKTLAELMAQVGDEPLVRLCLQECLVGLTTIPKVLSSPTTKRLTVKPTKRMAVGKRSEKEREAEGLGNLQSTINAVVQPLSPLQHWEEGVVKRVRETVRWLFGKVVRASSLVETVN